MTNEGLIRTRSEERRVGDERTTATRETSLQGDWSSDVCSSDLSINRVYKSSCNQSQVFIDRMIGFAFKQRIVIPVQKFKLGIFTRTTYCKRQKITLKIHD